MSHPWFFHLGLALLLGLGLLGESTSSVQAALAAPAAVDHRSHCRHDEPAHHPESCCHADQPCSDTGWCLSWCTVSCSVATGAAPLPGAWRLDHDPAGGLHPIPRAFGPWRAVPPPERPPRA